MKVRDVIRGNVPWVGRKLWLGGNGDLKNLKKQLQTLNLCKFS